MPEVIQDGQIFTLSPGTHSTYKFAKQQGKPIMIVDPATDKRTPKEVIQDFEKILHMAELKALSNYSLEHPLTDSQYKRMMELKAILFTEIPS